MISTTILAAAGGGSSGFGGGGGGGGGGFGGGGGGFGGGGGYVGGGGGAGGAVIFVLIALVVVLLVVRALVVRARRAGHEVRVARLLSRRRRAVSLAAAEAAEDDAAFAHDDVVDAARTLFLAVQQAWDAGDRDRLRALAGPDLLEEWFRRLDDFRRRGWRNRVSVEGTPQVDYVGMVNREDDADDRVVVRIAALTRDRVTAGQQVMLRDGATSDRVRLEEFWTLGKRDGRWILLSIEQAAEGEHQLRTPLVASPWGDTERLRDEALVEGAVADAALPGFATADLADLAFDGDARAQALDLALADGRFAPDVLEVAVRAAVAAWTEAVDGADDALEGLASPEAVRALLHPGDPHDPPRTRLVVRGGVVDAVSVERLDAEHEPAAMHLEVRWRGHRYVEDRDTAAVLAGDPAREVRAVERWTFALADDARTPWRLVAAADGARKAARS